MSQDQSEAEGAAVAVCSSDELVQYKADCAKRAVEQLLEIAAALTTYGVKRVRATYEGCGDSGSLEDPEYFGEGNAPILAEAIGEWHDKVADFLYDLIDRRHGGYENNEGGGGDFEWDLTAEGLIHEHYSCFTERDYSTHSGVES